MNDTKKPLALVTMTVLLQLTGAALLKQATLEVHLGLVITAVFIAAAFGMQGARFLLWGYAHRRWPLSMTYPMTAIFFPLLIALAMLYGEQVALHQWLGGLLISAGVAWITFKGME